jgi:hypothetical protein
LPVVERAGRPENEDDKEERPEHSLNNRLPMERIHVKHQAGTIVAAIWPHAQNGEPLQRSGSSQHHVFEPEHCFRFHLAPSSTKMDPE